MQITLLVCLFWQRLYPYGARSVAERSRRRSGRMQLLRMRVVLLSVDQPEPKEHLLAPTTYSKFEVPFVCLLVCVFGCVCASICVLGYLDVMLTSKEGTVEGLGFRVMCSIEVWVALRRRVGARGMCFRVCQRVSVCVHLCPRGGM
jgi:hypothetical protein